MIKITKTLELEKKKAVFVKYFLQETGVNPDKFRSEIHPEDEMFYNAVVPGIKDQNLQKAYLKYLESGKRTSDIVDQIVKYCFSGFDNVDSFLEFACGHGRFSRFLVQKMDAERIWASDIYETAVEWQRNYFGVNALLSCTNPNDFVCEEKFSFILVGSLFSHLPDASFKAWLKRLYDLLDSKGVLAFSVRDEESLRKGELMGNNGIAFAKESESDILSHTSYGLTHVTRSYVENALNNIVDDGVSANYAYFKKALYENQSLYVVAKDPSTVLSGLDLKITPIGGYKQNNVNKQGERIISGWGIDLNAGKQISEAELIVDDKILSRCTPVVGNHHVLKYFPKAPNDPVDWTFTIGNINISDDTVITCRLKSNSGAELMISLQ